MEFFIAVSQTGKQIILETHSEHFVNSLRYQVVKSKSPHDEKLTKDVKIYFTEKNENKETTFKDIKVNKYSAISDWPDDFFDESSKMADNIFSEAANKWKNNKKDNNE